MKSVLAALQGLGRALMLPVAVLPVAGLLLRLGQPDVLNIAPLAAAGDGVFSNLGLLFAVGVAVGLAKENHGAAGLAALVGYLVASKGAETLLPMPPGVLAGVSDNLKDMVAAAWKTAQMSRLAVPLGIISGIIGGLCYNRFSDVQLPSSLAFFGGRRLVPILCGCIGIAVALVFGTAWPRLASGMDALSHAVLGAGSLGLFGYGLLNRILIITGLHHILNNIAWFVLGDYHGATGDLNRFFAGDPSAGEFMSGFFPVMMFGLPAACLAMYHAALPERRQAVGGLFLSMALTAFLTGVTEPIEFTFIFLAPALYALHAVLTGLAMVLMHVAGVRLGFTFSAGLFDYVLNYGKAARPLWLLPIGLGYFALYYAVFRFAIARLNLATPGREPVDAATVDAAQAGSVQAGPVQAGREQPAASGAVRFIQALGGAANLRTVDACTTRLRLTVADAAGINREALKALGARGVVVLPGGAVQVVLGAQADQVASRIRAALKALPAANLPDPGISSAGSVDVATIQPLPDAAQGAVPGALPATGPALTRPWPHSAAALAALGGAANLKGLELGGDRLLVRLGDESRLDVEALRKAGARGVAQPAGAALQILLGADAVAAYAALRLAAGA